MPTDKQALGDRGEKLVCATQSCPSCKRNRTLRALPRNFKCADVICDFCGFLAQVKSFTSERTEQLPSHVLGAAWGPQKERMDAGIYYPLYILAIAPNGRSFGMWYLPADLQCVEMFVPRKPLKSTAKRAGWQGFIINLRSAIGQPVRL